MNKIVEFFKTEYKKWIGYVRKLIDDTAERDAEDVVQDVILHIFDRADIGAPIENLSAYIYQSLRNRVVDLLRKRKDILSLSEAILASSMDTADEFEKRELQEKIFQAMDYLNDEERAVVIATEFDGGSFRELSDAWGVPIGTLLARKSRALKKIRQKLTESVKLS
ncbi:MAG: sigma-70 family RNA polymerase sigma factor [Candidatus Aminicenantes bacterium]|nr:sigma-70 family RNA polymerase sigma factor [Candidatus Aminicenantes bacterium]MDH5467011.1 sigma-70 family RNA polymerase sigma factor [Candidatus Aminicenantes bacterium]MDH5704404.1 sigma-70 family RNA polymerase sigma factor [Candidatus Aminicenantes bacterium]